MSFKVICGVNRKLKDIKNRVSVNLIMEFVEKKRKEKRFFVFKSLELYVDIIRIFI